MVLMPVLLMILYPLSPALRLYEFVRWLMGQVLAWLEMEEEEEEETGAAGAIGAIGAIDNTIAARMVAIIKIDTWLSIIEQFLHAIIGRLAADQLGLSFRGRKKPTLGLMPRPQPGKHLTFAQVFARFERLVQMFQDIDRLARRRAARLRSEIEANPLGLVDLSRFGNLAAACRHLVAVAIRSRIETGATRYDYAPLIRGPPSAASDCLLPTAHCLAAPASENETSCPKEQKPKRRERYSLFATPHSL